jgi:hypothetical protein
MAAADKLHYCERLWNIGGELFAARSKKAHSTAFSSRWPSLFRRKYFLSANLVDEMLSAQVRQMRPFLLIRQVCSDSVDHHHDEGAIIHVQPIRPTDELIGTISNEGAIRVAGEIRFVKTCHDFAPVLKSVIN